MACISKTLGPREKQSEIWDSWILVIHTLGTFDLVRFKVILWSFSSPFPKMASSSKMAGCGVRRTEIWDPRILVTYIWGRFDLVGFKVILGHSVHLSRNGL